MGRLNMNALRRLVWSSFDKAYPTDATALKSPKEIRDPKVRALAAKAVTLRAKILKLEREYQPLLNELETHQIRFDSRGTIMDYLEVPARKAKREAAWRKIEETLMIWAVTGTAGKTPEEVENLLKAIRGAQL